MTLQEANQIHYITQEIKSIKLELNDLEAERRYFKSTILSNMPKGRGEYRNTTDDFLVKQEVLKDTLEYSLRKLQEERKKFEEFLKTVDDKEIRLILRFRCVNNMRWEDIGAAVGMDRRTASRKFYHFFKLAHNAHDTCDNI